MSAYLHDAEHLRVIVHAAATYTPREGVLFYRHDDRAVRVDDREAAMTLLAVANARSVVARYADLRSADYVEHRLAVAESDAEVRAEGYGYGRGPADRTWDDREVLQALASFDYQACESEDYAGSEAAALVGALRARLLSRYVRTLSDEGQQGAWSITASDASEQSRRTAAVRAERLAARS